MHTKKIALAAAVAVGGLGFAASTASAYSIDGIPQSSTLPSSVPFTTLPLLSGQSHKFQFGGASGPTASCTIVSFSGTATGAASLDFQPKFGGCTFLGGAATVTASGTWRLTATGGSVPTHTASIQILSGGSVTVKALGGVCTVNVVPQLLGSVTVARQSPFIGSALSGVAPGITYTSSGCPAVPTSGTDGKYTLSAPLTIPSVGFYDTP